MTKKNVTKRQASAPVTPGDYSELLGSVSELLETARHASVRAVNAFMTATYWEVGRRIVEFEQGGEKRAGYGEELLARLAEDLTTRFGRGFSRQNLQRFRQFYLSQPAKAIRSTLSGKSTGRIRSTPSGISEASTEKASPFALGDLARTFPLPNMLLVREYLTALPDEKLLSAELEKTRKQLEARK